MKHLIFALIVFLPFRSIGQIDTLTNEHSTAKVKLGSNPQSDSIWRASMRVKVAKMIPAKDFKGAVEVYSQMLDSFPNDLKLIHDRAVMYMMAQDYTKAVPDFTKLIDSNYKDISEAYYFRGVCKATMHGNACEDLLKAKTLRYKADWTNLLVMCPSLK